jgi:hypothetical protein
MKAGNAIASDTYYSLGGKSERLLERELHDARSIECVDGLERRQWDFRESCDGHFGAQDPERFRPIQHYELR